MSERPNTERAMRLGVTAWAIIGWVIVVLGVLWLLGRISGALAPFFVGGIIALTLRGPVATLERKGLPRSAAVALSYVTAIAVLAVVGAFVVPALGAQLQQFLHDFPGYYGDVSAWWNNLLGQAQSVVLPDWVRKGIESLVSTVGAQLTKWASSLAGGVISVGQSAATTVFDLVLGLVVGFWTLKDLPKVRDEVIDLFGEARRAEAEVVLETVLRVLGGYVRGQLIVSAVTGTLVAIGLSIIGVPYALILGIMSGLLNIIPYVGPAIGALVAATVGMFVSPLTALLAIVAVFAAQQITDIFITPRVMSEQVDLHPLLVIFSLLVGGTLAGFWGLLLAIPVAAISKGLFVYYFEKHTKRTLGSEDGALFRTRPGCEPTDEECVAEETSDAPANDTSRSEETDA